MSRSNPFEIIPGALIEGRYEVVKVLGCGVIGTAVLVLDRELDRQSLVLKILHRHLAADAAVIKRFHSEAILARQLTHPNIVRVYDVVAADTLQFLTMEFVPGCNLEE